uniref:CRAL-TRIO domain-containing protein n=1 Tax=Macrostomum lignano TaxID=282301 RepID=A0A1I8J942_9PLAT
VDCFEAAATAAAAAAAAAQQQSLKQQLQQQPQLHPQVHVVSRGASELLHIFDRELVKRLTEPNKELITDTVCCTCCGRNFARAFTLQSSLVGLFKRRDEKCSERERKFLVNGDLEAWAIADADCQPATALERLEAIRRTYRRLGLGNIEVCTVCLHKPGFHLIEMAGLDTLGRPVIFSSFSLRSSMGLAVADLPAYLAHLFHFIIVLYLPKTQHGVCLFFDCAHLNPSHCTVDTVSSVAEVLKLLPCQIAYAVLYRLPYLLRRLLVPLLYLTGLQDKIVFLTDGSEQEKMLNRLRQSRLFSDAVMTYLVNNCFDAGQ